MHYLRRFFFLLCLRLKTFTLIIRSDRYQALRAKFCTSSPTNNTTFFPIFFYRGVSKTLFSSPLGHSLSYILHPFYFFCLALQPPIPLRLSKLCTRDPNIWTQCCRVLNLHTGVWHGLVACLHWGQQMAIFVTLGTTLPNVATKRI